ncbi:hypothetical protein SPHINGO391_470039 [Sphingomonas aurantiaca]|uniref:Uncharacterized protein n=1 Tax=Sphingomonas aurantiaca TaxID=185949 RepID=A0A5E7ZUH1_9SPHN|nr:hypothetical protein SPHINGO391_470039 [Sphingomonas aurantiaca]
MESLRRADRDALEGFPGALKTHQAKSVPNVARR